MGPPFFILTSFLSLLPLAWFLCNGELVDVTMRRVRQVMRRTTEEDERWKRREKLMRRKEPKIRWRKKAIAPVGHEGLRRLADRNEMLESAWNMKRISVVKSESEKNMMTVHDGALKSVKVEKLGDGDSESEEPSRLPDYPLSEVPDNIKHLLGPDYLVRQIPADGGCLYGSVCAFIYGHTYYRSMRKQVGCKTI